MTTYTKSSPDIGDVLAYEINPSYCRALGRASAYGGEDPVALKPGALVATLSDLIVPWNPEAEDDSATMTGVLLTDVPIDAVNQMVSVLVRGPAIVNKQSLSVRAAGAASAVQALTALGIVVAGEGDMAEIPNPVTE